MTTPMPETMSPREKVAELIWERFAPSSDTDRENAHRGEYVIAADAILAALASSGDHAELVEDARLALEALIAEVAALRGAKWEVQHVDTMNDMVLMGMARDDAEARATEAERKLAEAVGLLRDVVSPGWTRDAWSKARAFLSKEAERG